MKDYIPLYKVTIKERAGVLYFLGCIHNLTPLKTYNYNGMRAISAILNDNQIEAFYFESDQMNRPIKIHLPLNTTNAKERVIEYLESDKKYLEMSAEGHFMNKLIERFKNADLKETDKLPIFGRYFQTILSQNIEDVYKTLSFFINIYQGTLAGSTESAMYYAARCKSVPIRSLDTTEFQEHNHPPMSPFGLSYCLSEYLEMLTIDPSFKQYTMSLGYNIDVLGSKVIFDYLVKRQEELTTLNNKNSCVQDILIGAQGMLMTLMASLEDDCVALKKSYKSTEEDAIHIKRNEGWGNLIKGIDLNKNYFFTAGMLHFLWDFSVLDFIKEIIQKIEVRNILTGDWETVVSLENRLLEKIDLPQLG